jgi:hypothetical protein
MVGLFLLVAEALAPRVVPLARNSFETQGPGIGRPARNFWLLPFSLLPPTPCAFGRQNQPKILTNATDRTNERKATSWSRVPTSCLLPGSVDKSRRMG